MNAMQVRAQGASRSQAAGSWLALATTSFPSVAAVFRLLLCLLNPVHVFCYEQLIMQYLFTVL